LKYIIIKLRKEPSGLSFDVPMTAMQYKVFVDRTVIENVIEERSTAKVKKFKS